MGKKENLGSKIINTIVGVVDSILGTEKENNSTNSLNETLVNTTSLEDGENSDDNATVEHFPTNETSVHSNPRDELPIVTVISTGTDETQISRLVLIPPTTPPLHPLRFLGNQYNMGGPTSLLSTQICWFLEYIYRASIKRCVISPHNNTTSCGENFQHSKISSSVNYNDVIMMNDTENDVNVTTRDENANEVKEERAVSNEKKEETPDAPKMAESGPSISSMDEGITGGAVPVKVPGGEKLAPIDLEDVGVTKQQESKDKNKKEVVKEKPSEPKQETAKKPIKKEENTN